MKHKHHDLIVQWAKDTTQVVEYRRHDYDAWIITHDPSFAIQYQYRIRHKHQDLIDQKEARPELIVQIKSGDEWVSLKRPCCWNPDYEYRLVEPEKKKVEMWQWIYRHEHNTYITQKFYKTEAAAIARISGFDFRRADWTRIEVEE